MRLIQYEAVWHFGECRGTACTVKIPFGKEPSEYVTKLNLKTYQGFYCLACELSGTTDTAWDYPSPYWRLSYGNP